MIDLSNKLSLPVHPVQIYSSFAALILFLIVTKLWKNYLNKPGFTIAFYVLLYGLIRFFIEFFRGDVDRYNLMNLSFPQYICIILFLVFLSAIPMLQKRYRIPR